MDATIKSLITPPLLNLMVECQIPFPTNEPIDFSQVARNFMGDGDAESAARFAEAAWPPLQALSKIGLVSMPDLRHRLLPQPSDPLFPKQCLGLQILLDQAPRQLFKGVDKRWQTGYFDVLAQRLAHTWLSLPAHKRPDALERWTGVSFDWWLLARLWFTAPFAHSESVADQLVARELTEDTRRAVEEAASAAGARDPWRERRDEVLADVYGFPRVIRAGTPLLEPNALTRESWSWWLGMVIDIHYPIIARFGRYPYNNAAQGRESTQEEVEWLDEVEHFAEASPEVAKEIKEDVAVGRWQQLGAGSCL